MAIRIFRQYFEGYTRAINMEYLPRYSGVYCVYTCNYDIITRLIEVQRLIYIGRAKDIQNRIRHHEKWDDWEKYIKKDQYLCFTYTEINSTDIDRLEAALIHANKPVENAEYLDIFPFDTTYVHCSGRINGLKRNLTVRRNENN